MNTTIPESYKSGIEHIEGLNFEALREWLEAELRDKIHILSGQADDYPVQAIVNHHPYFSLAAQKRVADAVEALIVDWRKTPDDWPESAVRALLSLSAELRVIGAKLKFQSLVESGGLSRIKPALHPAVFRAIATLSSNNDHKFWYGLPKNYPQFAGMAFQDLARNAPKVALLLLGQLPANEPAIAGVARKLPDFVSEFEPEQQVAVLSQITEALASLTPESAMPLQLALKEQGFDLGEIRFPIASQHKKPFVTRIISFAQTIQPRNELNQLYADA
jgi:hypothetical protein